MHVLPAILQFEHGRALPFMLSGETLPRMASILTVQYSTFKLKSVSIGNVNPPIQTFELRNDGIWPLEYRVDLTSLVCLQEENYGFEVLACLNPSGAIPPSETLLLNWYFRPIEAKMYSVEVFISLMNGEGAKISIEGSHLMKNDTDQPKMCSLFILICKLHIINKNKIQGSPWSQLFITIMHMTQSSNSNLSFAANIKVLAQKKKQKI
jgi:hypothetical protein